MITTPYEIIEYLRITSGTNDKRDILKEHRFNVPFQEVLTYAYDPRITYGIKKIPLYKIVLKEGFKEELLSQLCNIKDVLRTSSQDHSEMKSVIDSLALYLVSSTEKSPFVVENVEQKEFKISYKEVKRYYFESRDDFNAFLVSNILFLSLLDIAIAFFCFFFLFEMSNLVGVDQHVLKYAIIVAFLGVFVKMYLVLPLLCLVWT